MNRRHLIGAVVAMAAASLVMANTVRAEDAPKEKKVKCAGINSCKGKGACAAADGSHSCAGMNSCKGKGWVMASEKDCKEKGGTVVPEKKGEEEKKG